MLDNLGFRIDIMFIMSFVLDIINISNPINKSVNSLLIIIIITTKSRWQDGVT